VTYSRKKDCLAAAKELQNALSIDPEFVEARAYLGVHCLRLGWLEEAERELLRAIELDPMVGAIYTNLAVISLRNGRDTSAVEYGQHAVQLDPTSGRAHLSLGFGLIRSQATDEGMRHLRIAEEGLPRALREAFEL
jgi:Flp pilus assembly protein TadD